MEGHAMTKGLLALLIVLTACATPLALNQKGYVGRTVFTTEIDDREPQNRVNVLPNDHKKVYYFTELRNMKGQTVTHRWAFKGKVMARIRFVVRGDRWRVYSSKKLEPQWLGQWTASVVDSSGRILSSDHFSYARASRARRISRGIVPAAPADESILSRGARGAQSIYKKMFGDR